MRGSWLVVPLLGLASAQGTLYRGQLDHLEWVGECGPHLPRTLEATLVLEGTTQGYLLGPGLVSSRLEGSTLSSPLAGQAEFAVQVQTPPGGVGMEATLTLQTPLQGCSLKTAHLQLQPADDPSAVQWLELGRAEYAANVAFTLGRLGAAAWGLAQSQPLSQTLRGEVSLVWQQAVFQAVALERLGRIAEAFPLYQEAALHLAKLLGETDSSTLIARQGMASALAGLGRTEEALTLVRTLAADTETNLGPDHLQTLNALRTLADLLGRLGKREEALAVYRQVYARARDRYGDSDRITLNERRAWAGGLLLAGRKAEAKAEYLEVYSQALKTLGADHYETLMTLEGLADAAAGLGQYDQAIQYLELAQYGWGQRLGEGNPAEERLLGTRAGILWRQGRFAEAKPLYAQVIEGLERLRSQPLPPEERRRLLSDNLVFYQNYMILLAEDHDLSELFRVSELVKGRTLLDTLAGEGAALYAGLPGEAVRRLEGYTAALNRLSTSLLTAQGPDTRRLLAEQLRINAEYAQYQQALEQQYPRYAELNRPKLLDVPQALQAIPPHTAFLSYVEVGDALLVLVLTQERLSVVGVMLPSGFERTVLAYRELLATPDGALGLERQGQRVYRLSNGSFTLSSTRDPAPPGAVRMGDWRMLSRELSRLLLEPVRLALAGVEHLVLSPDGPLAFVPFETLGLDGKLLLERYSLRYTPSLSVYAALQERARQLQQLPRSGLLALGNPVYNPQVHPTRDRSQGLLATLRQQSFAWAPLPGTGREVTAAAQVFAPAAQVWTGAEASVSSLQASSEQGILAGFRYLLLAAHGYVNPDVPQEVAILLSPSPGDDGVLDPGRVLGLRLQSDLVILSACQTGLGQRVRGEGVVGLAYAFFVAGNLNTVLTLWSIDDASSSGFSPRLLERLKAGVSPEEALRQTKLEFLRQPGLAHPAYWAAFVLY